MLEKYKIRLPHRDAELLLSIAAAVFAALFPQYIDAALIVLAAVGARFGVRIAGAIGQGLEAGRALSTLGDTATTVHGTVHSFDLHDASLPPYVGSIYPEPYSVTIADQVPDPNEPRDDSQAAALADGAQS